MVEFEAIGTPKPDFAYYGDRPTWLVTLGTNPSADQVTRSNWRFITSGMLLAYPDDVAIESMSHWAVGSVEYLLVRPGTRAVEIMREWAEQLAVYPLADEEDFARLQAEEDEDE